MTEKRGSKKNTSGVKILEEECVTVQRLSAEVSGKAQKYTRVGAREFVPFEYDEVTVENIKRACLSHFDVREGCVCDVLAGEQGPKFKRRSCKIRRRQRKSCKNRRNPEKEGTQDECDEYFAKCIADKVDSEDVHSP